MTADSSTSLEAALTQALQDLQSRSKAQDQLQADVALAERLNEYVQTQHILAQYESRLAAQQNVIDESALVRRQQREQQEQLADSLVKELWEWSRRMGDYEALRENHASLMARHDETLAKLSQAEEDLIELKERSVRRIPAADASKAPEDPRGHETKESGNIDPLPAVPATNVDLLDMQAVKEPTTPATAPSPIQEPAAAIADGKVPGQEQPSTVVQLPPPLAPSVPPPPLPAPERQATVTLVSINNDDEEIPNLTELDTEILMRLFGFMDALDILALAQLNISMYSRIDALFGLGPQHGGGGGGDDNSTIVTAETMPSSQPTTAASTAQTAANARPAVGSNAPVSEPAPTRVALPPPKQPVSPPPTNNMAAAAASAAAIGTAAPAIGQFFQNFMQPRSGSNSKASSPMRSPTAQAQRGAYAATGPNIPDNAQPMNAAMANSMAAKLSDAELNAIILMTERLKQKEQAAEKLQHQVQTLQAQLDGTESVKQFLIQKCRDLEQSLRSNDEVEMKVAQQIASDQEVIGFLDSRIQDLERAAERHVTAQSQAEADLRDARDAFARKSQVMQDMLQFERQKLQEAEREWRVTKKLLVREVKQGRGQLASVTAERDGLAVQNDRLRQAVSGGSGGGEGMTRGRLEYA